MQKKHLQPHTRTYDAHLLTNKVFSNMKRLSKGYTGVEVPLFPSMLNAPSTSLSRITSSPSLSPEPSPSPQHTTTSAPSTSQPQHSQPSPAVEENVPTPHDSPLHSVHSHRSNEDEDAAEDSSKQGRKISDIDEDPNVSLVQDKGSGGKDEREVSTAGAELSTGKNGVNTASGSVSTATVSTASEIDIAATKKAKEKGKGIMTEPEPPKKLKKRVQVQLTIDEELAKKLFEEEHTRFNDEQEAKAMEEQEQEKSNFENMAVYKMEYFKGMSYDDIRPMFEVEYNKVQTLLKNKDVEEEKGQKGLEEFAKKTKTEQGVKEISKKTGGMRRKSLARKRTRETQDKDTSKRQKHDEEETTDYEEEELRLNLKIEMMRCKLTMKLYPRHI
ncbi:hypothetical protein Tco_1267990 [Tanacetum coccineum]